MKATSGELPHGSDWAFEVKWDGVRLLAWCDPEGSQPLMLRSRTGRDITATYPELADLPTALGTSAALDGEVVCFDGDTPSFNRLQHRMHVDAPSALLVEQYPVVYLVFDLLVLDGRSLLDLPYATRRRFLDQLVADGPSWRVPPMATGDGRPLLRLATERQLEGVVAKRLSSPYEPGVRSRRWVKVKIRRSQEVVVGGWLEGQRGLAGQMGSLLVGVWADGRLHFAGAVGSGLTDRDRALLDERFTPTDRCPFAEIPPLDRSAVWVEPEVVVEVTFGEWSLDGRLRHPVYTGLRSDIDPAEVVREPLGSADVGSGNEPGPTEVEHELPPGAPDAR
jgi:bifunctional non-homologous end joining protein LigD